MLQVELEERAAQSHIAAWMVALEPLMAADGWGGHWCESPAGHCLQGHTNWVHKLPITSLSGESGPCLMQLCALQADTLVLRECQ